MGYGRAVRRTADAEVTRFAWRPRRTQFALACVFVAVDFMATLLVDVPNDSLGSDGALYSLAARTW